MKFSKVTTSLLSFLCLLTLINGNPAWTYKCANSPGESIKPCGLNQHEIIQYLTPAICVQKCTCTWTLAYPEPKVILSCGGFNDCTGSEVESQCNNQDVNVLPFDFQGGQCSCVQVKDDEEVVKRVAEMNNLGRPPGGDDNSIPAVNDVHAADTEAIPETYRGSKRSVKARNTPDHAVNFQCKNNPTQQIGACGSNSHGIPQYLTPAICLQNCKCNEIAVELADAVICQPYLDCDWVDVGYHCTDQTADPADLVDYQGGQCACVVI